MRSFIFAIFVLFVSRSFGQDAYERYTNHLSVEGSISASMGGLNITPALSIYRNSSKIDLGLNVKVFDIWKDGPGIIGGYVGYKYYPNHRDRDFNLYFGYNSVFTSHNKGKLVEVIFDNSDDGFRTPDRTFILENMLGIGFDFQAGNNFYFFNEYSAGVALDWETFTDSETITEVRSTGLVRLGIGYNIPKGGGKRK